MFRKRSKETSTGTFIPGGHVHYTRKERYFATLRPFAIAALSFVIAVCLWWPLLRELHRQYGGRTMV
jgi:hypothetical protein